MPEHLLIWSINKEYGILFVVNIAFVLQKDFLIVKQYPIC
ncbi:hypothetical protein PRABACTJOHN_03090 [Parabacteroides johnsonii DSM 18315]|jgi:hypothetical protein|uniref:Uncharacterized protein n=1 Tax=Parabacteroides johnsonii DSM 18315 TaxID=537006 RepID=B7BDG8_9BACT|nr:hypothetical protein PRABACTJOHN_03090 [Parabacteroides johnsonii DSM 18315]